MGERRIERVGHRVQAELGRLLIEEARDERLRGVTITGVRMTADLRIARVYVRTLAPVNEHAAVMAALERAKPFLRREVGHALGLRASPELRFAYDELPDTADRLEALLEGRRKPEDEGDEG
ncbi:MAG: 30S ribosome-binding factor RbfA [Candidatus Binatia bacterium]